MEEMEKDMEMESVEDCKMILSQMKKQSRDCLIKRRWLMGMELTLNQTKHINDFLPPKDGFLPESMLREDDIYSEFLKNHILAFSGESENLNRPNEMKKEDDEDKRYAMLFDSQGGLREVFDMLDGMKIQALRCFAQLLTGGSDDLMKTEVKMRRLIRKNLQEGLNDKSSYRKQKIVQMSKILRDPNNYDGKHLPHLGPSDHRRAAALKILNEIDNIPIQALASMHRKLRSINVYSQIQIQRCGWSHGSLVEEVRKKCMKFLSDLGEDESLQLPLARALTVASLAVKLKSRSTSLTEIQKFSPEIDALQNDIMEAIWLLEDEKKLSFTEVKDLLLLLDPNAQANKRIRISIRKLMTEYLFECASMDIIPECLRKALSFIAKRAEKVSCHRFSKEELGTEVEGVLTVSSQAKQIIWDFLPECVKDLDIEYAAAYLDDMSETDDDYFSDDGLKGTTAPSPYSDDLYNQIEGFGESWPSGLTSPFTNRENREDSIESGIKNMDELESLGNSRSPFLSLCFEQEENGHIIAENKYLTIQKACDKSSAVAYHLIGGLLTKFADVEGLDLDRDDLSYLQSKGTASSENELLSWQNVDNYGFLVHILQQQIQRNKMPSLSSSSMEKLKKIMT